MLALEAIEVVQGAFRLEADITVAEAARVAVIGPSGGGKSTLLSVIAGFLAPDRGRVTWRGHDLGPLAPGARPLSILFQDNNLFPHLNAGQNVGLGLRPDLRLSRSQHEQVAQAMRRVGLEGLEQRRPAALSGGQQSRVALARVLLRAQPVLLLDEPFAALGPALKAEMLTLVRDLTAESGITLLMVTHDPADARAMAEQTVLVADGVVHAPRPTAALLDDPPESLRVYLG